MRKIKNENETRNEIRNWLKARAPEWFKDADEHEISLLIINIIALRDVTLACFCVHQTTGKKADDELVDVLLQNWNEYVIADLFEKRVIEESPQ